MPRDTLAAHTHRTDVLEYDLAWKDTNITHGVSQLTFTKSKTSSMRDMLTCNMYARHENSLLKNYVGELGVHVRIILKEWTCVDWIELAPDRVQ
jgi:hypothetical protein